MKILKDIKIGVVGCGYWATNILKSLEELGHKNIYIYDNDANKSKLLKNKFKYIKIEHNLNDLINNIHIDCFFLVTPASTHYSIGKKILKNKKNLFVEKPATTNLNHLKELTRIALKNNTIFMVGYVYNFNPYIEYIKKIISSKKLGIIKYMYFERCNLGPIRNDTSCIWDLSSHDISTSIYILNKVPKLENAQRYSLLNNNSDTCNIVLKADRTYIEIKSSWIYPEKTRKLIIIGETKMLQFDELLKGREIQIYNKYASYPNIVKSFTKKIFKPGINIFIGKTQTPKIKFYASLKKEVEYFLNCSVKKVQPKTDGFYAEKISKIISEIEKKTKIY